MRGHGVDSPHREGTPPGIARDRCGPYALLDSIASGSGGIVYRARHLERGDEVALKTARWADPDAFESLRREAHALGRLRHPGVVRVLDHGIDAGLPWYAMELIHGGTLGSLWRSAGGLAAPPPRAAREQSLRLLQRLCAPLAFLHGEGIVHRDLKPDNVAIRPPDDQPVIVDFGLVGYWSAALAREALHPGGELVGTALYMAPEQIHGDYVDARADLYSLGCMLYEAVVGLPPFLGDTVDVLMQHVRAPAPPPSARAPGVDPRLEQLILRLLEKDPRRRVGFADDVAAELARFTGEAPADTAIGTYLYRPSFVGRDEAFATITASLDAVRLGGGACLLVGGESGAGKTRLAMEVTRAAMMRGFAVVTGECAAAESTRAAALVRSPALHPLQPLLRAVADACQRGGVATTERILGRRAKVLSAFEPALRTIPGYGALPEPAALSPAAERARALADLAEVMATFSAQVPLLLVVDDLQWADDMTVALLASLGEARLERGALLILGTFRSDEAESALADLLGAPHVRRLDLGRLARGEVGSMVSSMLAIDTPPQRLIHLLSRESEGNPFFVGEYLRVAVETGLLHRATGEGWRIDAPDQREDTRYDALPLPRSLRDLIERHIASLDAPVLAFLEAAAVVGRELDPSVVAEIVPLADDEALEAERQLMQRQILEASSGGRLRFVHDKLREAAYGRLAATRATALHGAVAAAIEARQSNTAATPAPLADLARHWELAGNSKRAVHYLGLAGEQALTTGAYRDANLMLTRALQLDPRPHANFRRARWQRMLGVASFGIGNLEASIRHSATALQGLGEHVPTSPAGWAALTLREIPRVLVSTLRAPRRARDDAMYEVAQACGQLATSHFYNADVVPAVANLVRGLDRAQRAGDDLVIAESCARLGYVTGAMGLGPVARTLFRRAHATAERAHDTSRHALALYLEAMYQEFLGRWDVCRALAEESAAILDGIGDFAEAETARAIASHGYFFAGILDRSRALSAEILRTAEEHGHQHHIGWGHYLIARCDVVLGDPASAIPRLEEARLLLEPLPDAIDILIIEGWLARALRETGRIGEAIEVARSLARRVASGKRPAVGQCVDGYAGWAELALVAWAETPGDARCRRDATIACAELRRFARIFRMARPAAHRCAAQAQWLGGRHRRALRTWRRSLAAAQALGMPYETARSLDDLARVLDGAEAQRCGADAARLWSDLRAGKALTETLGAPTTPSSFGAAH